MASLEEMIRHIAVAEDLQSVVRTMQTISSVEIRRHEAAEQAMAQYLKTVEMGLQVALRHVSHVMPGADGVAEGRTGVVVAGSEIGLCGGFNERLVDFALDRLSSAGIEADNRIILVIGTRAEASWREQAEAPVHLEEAPATVEALPQTVAAVLTRLDHWRENQGVTKLVLFHQRISGTEGSTPVEVDLLPISPDWLSDLRARDWPSRRLPVCFGDPETVTRNLVRQLLFARLFTSVIQSRTAEHAERMTAMQAADKSIADKLDDLRGSHRLLRQEVITSELLDIIGGYEASEKEADAPTAFETRSN